ncbi:hypothetical protein PHYSODRAFT_301980 [Phytophthora sojae]|uniref:Uncharacterized protein n=1 Tax=Phytophthora sojae (strain P6497) TaxID=1094619 RepID=G4ZPD9_PHYSP|nr:hypothetical protein PHYSODRAFT_301980 [Phytophthora sojae]EGZ15473.1 hypothetical protein PHYSODRAFT_301980 [Phytophthora sojae]|eukprot:XP_009529222.1 hypothetical protein PHYSODRAFT_301980 [Phytophthora sojae]
MDVDSDRDEVGCNGTDIAAAKGYTEAIKAIYRWWAATAGHDKAVKALLSDWYERELDGMPTDQEEFHVEQVYDFDVLEALELATKHNHRKTIRVICEKNTIPGEMLIWAAEHDNVQVFYDVYDFHDEIDMDHLSRALLIAVSRGCVHIVKFVFESCGEELLDHIDENKKFSCPLIFAIKQGQRDMVDYLYAHDRCLDISCLRAVGAGQDVRREGISRPIRFEKALASAASKNQLEIMAFLQAKREFDGKATDKAFVEAASNGQLDAAKYLDNIEGHQVSAPSLDEGFEGAAGGCHLEMLKFLDGKGGFSRKVVTIAFENAVKDIAKLGDTGKDQVRVLKFLHGKGKVYPEVIDELFPYAGGHCSAAVVEFL